MTPDWLFAAAALITALADLLQALRRRQRSEASENA